LPDHARQRIRPGPTIKAMGFGGSFELNAFRRPDALARVIGQQITQAWASR